MISAITSALSGLTSASKQIESSASNIANNGAQNASSGRVIEDIVDIKTAEVAYKANLQTIKVANELSQELLKAFDQRV